MAGDVSLRSGDENVCCRNWKEKYAKLEEKRNALRQAVKLLELQLDKVQAECDNRKNACDLERAQADLERQEKEKLLTVRAELEEKVCSLKLEVSSFQQKDCADVKVGENVKLLEAKISKGEAEIKHLKELLKKEKSRVDLERKNAESEMKRAAEAWKIMEAEKTKADEARKISAAERKKAEQCRFEVEKLKKEVDGFRSRLVIETVKCEETNKKLELEKQKTAKEKKHADKLKAKANEQRKLADEINRKFMEEKTHAVKLCEEVEAAKQRIKKLQVEKDRLLDNCNRNIMEEKDRVGEFSNEFEDRNRRKEKLREHANELPLSIGMTNTLGDVNEKQDNGLYGKSPSVLVSKPAGNLNFQKEETSIIMLETDSEMLKASGQLNAAKNCRKRAVEEKSEVGSLSKRQRIENFQDQAPRNPLETSATQPGRSKKVEYLNLKLCKEQLKLERKKAKHAKEVLEFERRRNNILIQEMQRIRFDFGQLSHRLDMLDSLFSPDSGGVNRARKNAVGENMDVLKNSLHICEPFYPCSLVETELLQPSGGGSSSNFVSGTDSRLELSRGGSNRKTLQSSAINSAMASFSDRGFLGSQDRDNFPAAIAEMVEDGSNWPATISYQSDEGIETQGHGYVTGAAENSLHSSLEEDDSRVERLEQKWNGSLEVIKFRDDVCADANKEHLCQLDGNTECREDSHGDFDSDFDRVVNPDGADCNYMRLLELDNRTDEIRYKLATERLLSPLHDSELKLIEADPVVENISQRIGPVENDHNVALSTLDVEERGVTENKLRFSASGNELVAASFQNQSRFSVATPPEYCVISSDIKDIQSISRIFNATANCMVQASLSSPTGWSVPNIFGVLEREEKLQAKEKICVFFSCLLLNFLMAWPGGAGHSLNRAMLHCIDSFTKLLSTVMADDKMRSLFEEECQIYYLLKVIEDFLVDGRVAICPSTCSGPVVTSISNLAVTLNGDNGVCSSKTASSDLLVAGGIVLASICAAINHTGFACEASYRIFLTHGSDTSLLLTIIHAFAYICGKNYFTLASYSSLMVVLKSLVTYIEGSFACESSPSCPMLSGMSDVGLSSSIRCPFHKEAVSLDVVTSLLLEKVEKTAFSSLVQSDETGLFCLSKLGSLHFEDIAHDGSFPVVNRDDWHVDVSCSITQHAMSADASEKKMDGNLCHTIEILSLLELIANVVGWEFAQNKIVTHLLKIFESCILETIAVGIMTLVGQVGRIGVVACGYEDSGVDGLRSKLCNFIGQPGTSNLGFTIQMAVVNALLSLLSSDFSKIVKNGRGIPASATQSLAACTISEWYSSLSRERQVLACSVLQSAAVDK